METLKRMTDGDWLRPSGQRMQLTLKDQVREPRLYPKQAAAGKLLVKGNLNPDWVEWLMGWPVGWTDLKPLSVDTVNEWMTHMLRHEWWNNNILGKNSILKDCYIVISLITVEVLSQVGGHIFKGWIVNFIKTFM